MITLCVGCRIAECKTTCWLPSAPAKTKGSSRGGILSSSRASILLCEAAIWARACSSPAIAATSSCSAAFLRYSEGLRPSPSFGNRNYLKRTSEMERSRVRRRARPSHSIVQSLYVVTRFLFVKERGTNFDIIFVLKLSQHHAINNQVTRPLQ